VLQLRLMHGEVAVLLLLLLPLLLLQLLLSTEL